MLHRTDKLEKLLEMPKNIVFDRCIKQKDTKLYSHLSELVVPILKMFQQLNKIYFKKTDCHVEKQLKFFSVFTFFTQSFSCPIFPLIPIFWWRSCFFSRLRFLFFKASATVILNVFCGFAILLPLCFYYLFSPSA